MGPWYRKVNALVEAARGCRTVGQLVRVLGEPDKIELGAETATPTKQLRDLGSSFHFGDEHAETILTYVDPYRPRFRYKFGVVGRGHVSSNWRETVHETQKGQV